MASTEVCALCGFSHLIFKTNLQIRNWDLNFHKLEGLCIAHGTLLKAMCQPKWERVWGRMDTCICMAESLCYSPETHDMVNQLCVRACSVAMLSHFSHVRLCATP